MRRGKTYSEEYQAELIRQYWLLARDRPWVCGISPWVFADFLCSWFPGNPVPGYNLKGLLSSGRVPKRSFFTLARLYHAAGDASADRPAAGRQDKPRPISDGSE